MERVFNFYGFPPDRHGYVRCPFHTEKTASLKIFTGDSPGWYCFGCGAGGSVIDFAMRLFDLTFPQAVLRLQSDFGLGAEIPAERRQSRSLLEETLRREAEVRAEREARRSALAAEHRYWWEAAKWFAPAADCAAGGLHPLHAEALRRLPELEWNLEVIAEHED